MDGPWHFVATTPQQSRQWSMQLIAIECNTYAHIVCEIHRNHENASILFYDKNAIMFVDDNEFH